MQRDQLQLRFKATVNQPSFNYKVAAVHARKKQEKENKSMPFGDDHTGSRASEESKWLEHQPS